MPTKTISREAAKPRSNEKILPCPFCGAQPEHIENHGRHYMECTSYECIVGPSSRGDGSLDSAIARWNTRAPLRDFAPSSQRKPIERAIFDSGRDYTASSIRGNPRQSAVKKSPAAIRHSQSVIRNSQSAAHPLSSADLPETTGGHQ